MYKAKARVHLQNGCARCRVAKVKHKQHKATMATRYN